MKLLQQMREILRAGNYSPRTEQSYLQWARRYIRFHNLQHPALLGEEHVIGFLTHLAVNRQVSPNTQNQALNALVFLYKRVLNQPLGDITSAVRARKQQKIPTVLSREEVKKILVRLEGRNKLIAGILYGSGLRLMECLQLRVKDLDFDYSCIHVHEGKGKKDRIVTLSQQLHLPLRNHLFNVREQYRQDKVDGFDSVYVPVALARKYKSAPQEWGWRYVFPATRISSDPESGLRRRHHIDVTTFQKAFRSAVQSANMKPTGRYLSDYVSAADHRPIFSLAPRSSLKLLEAR